MLLTEWYMHCVVVQSPPRTKWMVGLNTHRLLQVSVYSTVQSIRASLHTQLFWNVNRKRSPVALRPLKRRVKVRSRFGLVACWTRSKKWSKGHVCQDFLAFSLTFLLLRRILGTEEERGRRSRFHSQISALLGMWCCVSCVQNYLYMQLPLEIC